jgi:hypothetical protein
MVAIYIKWAKQPSRHGNFQLFYDASAAPWLTVALRHRYATYFMVPSCLHITDFKN